MNKLRPIGYSFADDFLGSRIERLSRSPFKKDAILLRMCAVALPFFHLLDTISNFCSYVFESLKGRKWIVLPSSTNPGVPVSAYLDLAHKHGAAIFKSVFDSITRGPGSAIYGFENLVHLPAQGITYQLMPLSRFGDNLLCYINAKWVAYKLGIPLIVRKFPHIDQLAIVDRSEYTLPQHLGLASNFNEYQVEKSGFHPAPDEAKKLGPGIFSVPFFPGGPLNIDWTDEDFRQSVLKDLALNTENSHLSLAIPQENSFNIALHLRTGGGFDHWNVGIKYPDKVSPLEFYEEALKHMIDIHPAIPINVQLFTDSGNPDKAIQHFKDIIAKHTTRKDITISYKKSPHGDTEEMVVTDMLSMAKFDTIIRSHSQFSKLAGLIGMPRVEITPKTIHVKGNVVQVEDISITTREKDIDGKVTRTTSQTIAIHVTHTYPFYVPPPLSS